MVNFTCNQCGHKYIYINLAWIDRLEEIRLIIQFLAVVNVRDHLLHLVIWRNISKPVLVVKLLSQLLLQLLRNDVLVLLQSLSCERLVNHLEVFTWRVHCEYERSKSFISIEGSYSCFHTCNVKVPPRTSFIQVPDCS